MDLVRQEVVISSRPRTAEVPWEEEKKDLERKILRLKVQLNKKSKAVELEKELLVWEIREDEQLSFQVQALEARLNSKEKRIDLLKQRLTGTEALLSESNKTMDELTREAHDWRDKLYDQEHEVEELRARCVGLESDLKAKTSQLEVVSAQSRGQSQQKEYIRALDAQASEINRLKTKVVTQENRIRDAQESVIQLHKASRYETMDDDEIRLSLESEVLEKTRSWARAWAADASKVNSEAYGATDLLEALRKVGDVDPEDLRQRFSQPRVIVTALLSQFLRENIFEEPFYQLGPGSGMPRMMKNLYDAFLGEKEPEAHAWRSSTLQLLSTAQSEGTSELRKFIETSGAGHKDTLVAQFLGGPVRYFLKSARSSESAQRKQKLGDLMSSSADLSTKLWRQRVTLVVRGFEYYGYQVFEYKSARMEAHRSLQITDTSRDGAKVKMVVQPGFSAFGNEDGERYDQEKIWGKAVVSV